MDTTWRHAVTKHVGPTESVSELAVIADELLTEWGAARGLTAVGGVEIEKWNYGRCVGFGLSFTGKKSAAGVSRLQGWGAIGDATLRGREEAWPPLDREPRPPSAEELTAAREREEALLFSRS